MLAPLVMIVEDDAALRSVIARGLAEEGFRCEATGTGGELLARMPEARPDALVVDVGLPDCDGRDVCQALRARGDTTPVIFLTARDALVDRLAGFDAGGDDYLAKPFALDELVARLRALVRRSGAAPVARPIQLPRISSAHFSAMAITVMLGFTEGSFGIAEASTTRSRCTPLTRSCGSSTAAGSSGAPILAVAAG